MTFDCMTDEELTLWRSSAGGKQYRRPCTDCPLWFQLQAQDAGCCNRVERNHSQTGRPPGRPRLSGDVPLGGRGHGYATEAERIAARRQTWREHKRRARGVQ